MAKKIGEIGCVNVIAIINIKLSAKALTPLYVKRTSDANKSTVPVAKGETCASI